MLSYAKVKDDPTAFRACTSLDPSEFDQLLMAFARAWQTYVENTYVKGKVRQRQYGGGRKARLDSIEDKLFFILFYFKTYPLQEVMGVLFGLSQSQTNEWIHRLSQVLQMALGQEQHLPTRDPQNLEAILAECPELEFLIDGTERRRQRPTDAEAQKAYYSGKKKPTRTRISSSSMPAPTRFVISVTPVKVRNTTRRSPMKKATLFRPTRFSSKTPVFKATNPRGSSRFNPRRSPEVRP